MQQRQNSLDDKEEGEEPLGVGSSPLPKRQATGKRASSLDPNSTAKMSAQPGGSLNADKVRRINVPKNGDKPTTERVMPSAADRVTIPNQHKKSTVKSYGVRAKQ